MNAAQAQEPRDLTQLIEKLRTSGLRVDPRQYLAAHEMLLAFAQRGKDLQADPEVFASHLGPIFCTSTEDQRLFETVFRSWWGVPPPVVLLSSTSKKKPEKRRLIATAAVVLVALAVVLGPIFYWLFHLPGGDPTPATPPNSTVDEPAPQAETASPIRVGSAVRVGGGTVTVPAQTRAESPWLVSLGGGSVCALVVLGSVWLIQRRRRKLALKRLPDAGNPELVTIDPPVPDFVNLSAGQLLRIATGMRRVRAQSSVSLCLEATVETTARAAGFVTPAFAPRLATPEYLVLLERRGTEDHLYHLMRGWIGQLRGHDVAVDCFDFHTDPRVCFDPQTLRRFRMADLLVSHHRAVVLLHAESATLFNDITGQLQPWLEPLLSMIACVLFTPTPTYRWGRRERMLIEAGVVVLPATPAGLQVVASMSNEWRQPTDQPSRYARDFPRVIGNRGTQWLERSSPPDHAIATLLQQVSGFLGPVGYQWLCACAVYPQISWATTLALLPDIVAPGDEVGRRRAIDECLPSLARLPWMRAGYMPDWLRGLLMANLPAEKEAAVRERLGRMVVDLVRQRERDEKPIAGALDIAKSLTALDVARAAPEGSPLGDRVFLGFLAGANPDPLTLTLPPASRAHGPRVRGVWEKLLGHWRGFLQMQPVLARTVASVMVGGLAAWALWKASSTNVYVPVAAADVTYAVIEADSTVDTLPVAISPNRQFMVIGKPEVAGAVIWDLTASKLVATLAPDKKIVTLAVSPDSRLVGAATEEGAVRIWSAKGDSEIELSPPTQQPELPALSFNRDGSRLAVTLKASVKVLDTASNQTFSYSSAEASRDANGVERSSGEPIAAYFGARPDRLEIVYPDRVESVDVTGSAAVEKIRFPTAMPDAYGRAAAAVSADQRYLAVIQLVADRVRKFRYDFFTWERKGSAFSAVGQDAPRSWYGAGPLLFLGSGPHGEVLVQSRAGGGVQVFDPREIRSGSGASEGAVPYKFDSQTLPRLEAGQRSLYTIRFTNDARATSTGYVVERRSLEIDSPAAAAPADTSAAAQEEQKKQEEAKRARESKAAKGASTKQSKEPPKEPPKGSSTQSPRALSKESSKQPSVAADVSQSAAKVTAGGDTSPTTGGPADSSSAKTPRPANAPAVNAPPANAPPANAPTANARPPNAPADAPVRGEAASAVLLQRNRFILPADGARPDPSRFPSQFCCEGYVAELRDDRNNVIGFIQLTFTNTPKGISPGTLAGGINVTAHVMRDLTQAGKVDLLKADYDSSDSGISVADYTKDRRHAESNTAGRLRFTVSIAKANVVGAGVSVAALEPAGRFQKVGFARAGRFEAAAVPVAVPMPPGGGSYFEVSSIQVQVTVVDQQYGGQTAK